MVKEYLALKNVYINKKLYKKGSHIEIDSALVNAADIKSGLLSELKPEPPEKKDNEGKEDPKPKVIDTSKPPEKPVDAVEKPEEKVEEKDEVEGNEESEVQEEVKPKTRKRRTTKKAQ